MKFTIGKNFTFIIICLAMISLSKMALASQDPQDKELKSKAISNLNVMSSNQTSTNDLSTSMDWPGYFHDYYYWQVFEPVHSTSEEEQNSRRVLTSHFPADIAVIVVSYLPGAEGVYLVVERDFSLTKQVGSLAFDNYDKGIVDHLTCFPNLKSLRFGAKPFNDRDLSIANPPATLTSLSLLGNGFTNSSLTSLRSRRNLNFLRVWGDNVTDIALEGMDSLISLDLSGNGFTKDVLSKVNKGKIERLEFAGDQFVDESLEGLYNVKVLLIRGNNFTDRALEGGDKTKIESLRAYGDQFSDAILRGLPKLEKLGISGSKFTNQALSYLNKSKIRSLKVFGDQFTTSILDDLENLESLEISGKGFTLSTLSEPLKVLLRLNSLVIHPIEGKGTTRKYLKYQGLHSDDDIEGFHEVLM